MPTEATLDNDYILNIRASLLLNEFLTEIEGTLYERGKQIASIGAPGQQVLRMSLNL